MRRKYNVFQISKINSKTIEIALLLKIKAEKTKSFVEVSLRNPETANVPLDKDRFLEYMSYKFLHLKPEDGIPLLKQAYKQQYNIQNEYRECKYCKKLFKFVRRSKDFCSNRCRQRFYRDKKGEEKDHGCYTKRVSL